VLGASGGVGTSTLARDLGFIDEGRWCKSSASRTVVVAAAGTADGMAAALDCVQMLQGGSGRIVVAVIDDGGGPCPPAVKARKLLLDGYVHAVVDVPYVPVWRYGGTRAEPTTAYLDAIRQLTTIATAPPPARSMS